MKKEVLHQRQIIRPQCEVLRKFAQGEFKLVRPKLVPYFCDVYDALFHIRRTGADLYLDSLNGHPAGVFEHVVQQTGEVVKLLTLITVITTPRC